jgi:ribosomal protein S18 acetylase RimI-like enzyme
LIVAHGFRPADRGPMPIPSASSARTLLLPGIQADVHVSHSGIRSTTSAVMTRCRQHHRLRVRFERRAAIHEALLQIAALIQAEDVEARAPARGGDDHRSVGRIIIRRAEADDAEGIARVCAEGWWDTYAGIHTLEQIESVIAEYYTPERIAAEIAAPQGWHGWIVAVDDGLVVGAGGGGMIEPGVGEIFVLYLDPTRRREGIGSLLIDAITKQQHADGAREQWVSVEPDNAKGLPFYEARGFEARGERPAWGLAPEEGRVSLRLMRRLDSRRQHSIPE